MTSFKRDFYHNRLFFRRDSSCVQPESYLLESRSLRGVPISSDTGTVQSPWFFVEWPSYPSYTCGFSRSGSRRNRTVFFADATRVCCTGGIVSASWNDVYRTKSYLWSSFLYNDT